MIEHVAMIGVGSGERQKGQVPEKGKLCIHFPRAKNSQKPKPLFFLHPTKLIRFKTLRGSKNGHFQRWTDSKGSPCKCVVELSKKVSLNCLQFCRWTVYQTLYCRWAVLFPFFFFTSAPHRLIDQRYFRSSIPKLFTTWRRDAGKSN